MLSGEVSCADVSGRLSETFDGVSGASKLISELSGENVLGWGCSALGGRSGSRGGIEFAEPGLGGVLGLVKVAKSDSSMGDRGLLS